MRVLFCILCLGKSKNKKIGAVFMQEMYSHAKPGSASFPVCYMGFKRKNSSVMEWCKKYLYLLP